MRAFMLEGCDFDGVFAMGLYRPLRFTGLTDIAIMP